VRVLTKIILKRNHFCTARNIFQEGVGKPVKNTEIKINIYFKNVPSGTFVAMLVVKQQIGIYLVIKLC